MYLEVSITKYITSGLSIEIQNYILLGQIAVQLNEPGHLKES